MNTTVGDLHCKYPVLQTKSFIYACTKSLSKKVCAIQLCWPDIWIYIYNIMTKKALDYDGNGLPRSFKSILCRTFEKIIIKHNCFKFKHSNNRYRKKPVIFFENVEN